MIHAAAFLSRLLPVRFPKANALLKISTNYLISLDFVRRRPISLHHVVLAGRHLRGLRWRASSNLTQCLCKLDEAYSLRFICNRAQLRTILPALLGKLASGIETKHGMNGNI